MNYTNYIGTLRNNLCHVLTALRDNEKKIKKIRESIENLEMENRPAFPLIAGMIDKELNIADMIDKELNMEIEFYETLNGVYNDEANRLVRIILDKQ